MFSTIYLGSSEETVVKTPTLFKQIDFSAIRFFIEIKFLFDLYPPQGE